MVFPLYFVVVPDPLVVERGLQQLGLLVFDALAFEMLM